MIIRELFKELELLLSDIAFTGIHNIQPVTIQKLEELKKWMVELNMPEGIKLVDAFTQSVKDYKSGNTDATQTVSCLCALEFYEKNISGNLL